MTQVEKLGKLQLEIMQVLWEHKEATASDVHAVLLPTHGLAPTTIATMLRKMERKGIVAHRAEGRGFAYRPTIAEPDVNRSMVGELVQRVFGGDPTALVDHLVREGEVDLDELDQLRAKLEKAQRRKS